MDYIITTSNDRAYLSHYGVLGMKWGHRKSKISGKEVQSYHRAQRKASIQSLNKKYKVDELRKEAYDYARRNHLDYDDGGGGSVKASQTYMKKWEKIEDLEYRIKQESSKKAADSVLQKYGDQGLSQMKKQNEIDAVKAVAIASAILLGPPIFIGALTRN